MTAKGLKTQPIPTALEEKLLWSVRETCERLGLGRTIVLALAYSNQLPSIKVGRRRMFPANRVRDWAASLPGAAPLTWDEITEKGDLELRQIWSGQR
jgi:excisionase family DNA binding protein